MLTGLLTAFTLIAFAANSLLCRIALGEGLIDPVSFTGLRLLSGAFLLVPLALFTGETEREPGGSGSWLSGLALFAYAMAFSLAYIYLDAGMGALILFGSVQATMLTIGWRSGERPHAMQWLGLSSALAGLIYLVSPGISAPHPIGASLMLVSGIAWGVYSIRGKNIRAPIATTAGNFARSVPLLALAVPLAYHSMNAARVGTLLAVLSGTVTSGLGYVLWYLALRRLSTTKAAIVQLLVPVLAAAGGVALLGEVVSLRMVFASALVLGGVSAAILKRAPAASRPDGIPASNENGDFLPSTRSKLANR